MSKTSSLDVSVKQWCNWRSPRNLVRPIPRHLIPFTWFTCSGNIVWMLLYPWQWTPADALVPAPVTGWSVCMDAGWAVPWLVLSDLGIGSGSPLQKTQLAVFPPSHHAYACCIPHDWTLPPGPGDHAPVEWNVSARMSHWLTGKDAFFPCIRCECLKTIVCTIRISNSVTKKKGFPGHIALKMTRCTVNIFRICCRLEVTPFERATYTHIGWKHQHNLVSCCFCPLTSDKPLSQPPSPDKKEPLLRCFARHYETVAMDTQSEQAPHTGSGIGNYRWEISHFMKKNVSPLVSTQADGQLC